MTLENVDILRALREPHGMAFHHLALATKDVRATHAFYTRACGFTLAKTIVAPTPKGGWAKHFFYDTGDGGLMAFWDLHDPSIPEFSSAISTGMGLPEWVNHVAFTARGRENLEGRACRWLDHGYDVLEVDHEWCRSIYTTDPNGILVEFCTDVRALGEQDAREALLALEDPAPPLNNAGPRPTLRRATRKPIHLEAA